MKTYKSKNGVIIIPELPVGTRFKIENWFDKNDFDGKMPDVEFEVMEAFPDETGDIPCHGNDHSCAFDFLCNNTIDCRCIKGERQDGKDVRYVEFIDGKEYSEE